MLELHPDMAQLRSFGLGQMGAIDSANLEEHILQCEACCEKLRLVSGDSLMNLAREASRTASSEETTDTNIPRELINHPRYRILSQIGEGGMGTVFKAEHRMMDRIVALKVIQKKFVSNPNAAERFVHESRMAAKLHHPNIVVSHDAEEFDGVHFLVMEYVEGISLDRFVGKQKGPIPYPLACHIIRQAAQGLYHAHSLDLVHRDIKPHNIMITRRGHVKILDFGLTRLNVEGIKEAGMTRENVVVGTPDFIAPEQARNSSDVDIRSDIYSLGCTFYYLLTRRVPFPGMTPFEKMIAHTEIEPHPVTDFRPDFPAELEVILRKMMSKRRENRYSIPAEVVAALAPYAKLNVNATTNVMNVQPVTSEAEAEVVTDRIDTDELDDSNTHRIPAQLRPRTSRTIRRKRRTKKLPYRTWIAGAMIGTFLMFVLIFMAALRGRTDGEESKNSKEISQLAKSDEKAPPTVPLTPNEKENPAPKEGGFTGKMVIEIPGGSFGKHKGSSGKGPQPREKREGAEAGPLRSKIILFVVPNRGAWFPDLDPVWDALEDKGAKVLIASSSDDRACTGLNGSKPAQDRVYRPTVDLGGREFDADHYRNCSAVICGGGDIGEFLISNRIRGNLDKLLNLMQRDRKLVASIGTGQVHLARAGILDGKEAAKIAPFPALKMFEPNEKNFPKAKWSDRKVVRSGNSITAISSEVASEFADEIVKFLLEPK